MASPPRASGPNWWRKRLPEPAPLCRLYLITPPRLDDVAAFSRALEAALKAGDVACLQIRLKEVDDAEIERAAAAIIPIAHDFEVAVLINDRPDLAARLGADGVHVGQDDIPYAEARHIVGDDAIVGVTCHASRHLAMEAGEAGADYVAFGAFYPTATKDPKARAEPSILSWWQALFEVPCVAIGGITPDNAAPLVAAGADFLAVSSGVWSHPAGAADAVRALTRLMAETPRKLLDFDA